MSHGNEGCSRYCAFAALPLPAGMELRKIIQESFLSMEVRPYENTPGTKKEQVKTMFDNIAGSYDSLNRILSLGIDVLWRKKAVNILKKKKPNTILDIATGTGDFAIQALHTGAQKIIGLDLSPGMLEVGRKKIKQKNLTSRIELVEGDSENLPFADNNFDAVIVAFGVRNFGHLENGLKEMHRVLKPGGQLLVLEFSKPKSFPVKQIYNLYFNHILPTVGKKLSGDAAAYKYLPESVNAFPEGRDFLNILHHCGYLNVSDIPLSFGISSIYLGEK